MTTYYVDPNATGANNGSSWGDAWTSLQSAADTASAGDTIYCRNTQTLAAPIDFDTNSGTLPGGYIKFIGCNAAGSVDGTCFVLDGNSAAANCIRTVTSAQSYIWFENFEFKNATDDGVAGIASSNYWIFVNCIAHNNGDAGFDTTGFNYVQLIGCQAYSNTGAGFDCTGTITSPTVAFCVAHTNGDNGFNAKLGSVYLHCIAHDNGANDYGFYLNASGITVIGCIADGENTGIVPVWDYNILLLNRITNNTTGINFGNELTLCGWNYFHGNTNDLASPAAWSAAGIYAAYIQWKSTTNTNQSETDADDGYNDRANDDFNLKASRTYNGDGNDVIDLGIGT